MERIRTNHEPGIGKFRTDWVREGVENANLPYRYRRFVGVRFD